MSSPHWKGLFLELPAETRNEPRLLSECPYCHKPLRFNPFIVDNRDMYWKDRRQSFGIQGLLARSSTHFLNKRWLSPECLHVNKFFTHRCFISVHPRPIAKFRYDFTLHSHSTGVSARPLFVWWNGWHRNIPAAGLRIYGRFWLSPWTVLRWWGLVFWYIP